MGDKFYIADVEKSVDKKVGYLEEFLRSGKDIIEESVRRSPRLILEPELDLYDGLECIDGDWTKRKDIVKKLEQYNSALTTIYLERLRKQQGELEISVRLAQHLISALENLLFLRSFPAPELLLESFGTNGEELRVLIRNEAKAQIANWLVHCGVSNLIPKKNHKSDADRYLAEAWSQYGLKLRSFTMAELLADDTKWLEQVLENDRRKKIREYIQKVRDCLGKGSTDVGTWLEDIGLYEYQLKGLRGDIDYWTPAEMQTLQNVVQRESSEIKKLASSQKGDTQRFSARRIMWLERSIGQGGKADLSDEEIVQLYRGTLRQRIEAAKNTKEIGS